MPKIKYSLIVVAIFLLLQTVFFDGCYCQNRDRDTWQQPEAIMDTIGVQPGMVIGEAGAGDGYFTFHLSKRVGQEGKIYANDIDKSSLSKLERRSKREEMSNITTIVGEVDDPLFPKNALDMVIIMNAFHEFDKPVEWMKNVIPSMKHGARLVIIDRDPDKMGYGWSHFKKKKEIVNTMEKTDFQLIRIETFLSRDNIYIYKLKESQN